MPYRNMSLDDFARYVGMDAREVQKLAERGQLPGQKVGGEWRFNRARVTEWLQQEMHTLDEERLVTIERTMGPGSGETGMILTDLIGLEGVDPVLRANTKGSVLRELVNLSERTGLLYDGQGLLKALEAREEMCSTGLQYGVAIPHPRQPMPYVSAEPMVCVARTSRGIGFGSPYGGLSRLFFLICCHDDRHHLQVLARLMRVLSPDIIELLMGVESREDVLGVLLEKEKQIVGA
jgi:PTS system nitrogen regulatory IIA component